MTHPTRPRTQQILLLLALVTSSIPAHAEPPSSVPFEVAFQTLNETIPSLTSPDSPSPHQSLQSDDKSPLRIQEIFRRQPGPCGTYVSCANLGQAGFCCPPSSACSQDPQGNLGCCPHGAACSGTVPQQQQSSSIPTTTQSSEGGAGAGAGVAVGSQSGSAGVTAQGGPTVVVSGGTGEPTDTSGSGGTVVLGAGAEKSWGGGDIKTKVIRLVSGVLVTGIWLLR